MSILDFTSGLFRDPANLRSFVDDPDQALDEAGLPDATPQQVHDLLPMVAESMPPDHPLQTVVHAADPVRALAELDVDELVADMHLHHHETHETQLVDKALGSAECRPGDDDHHDEDHHDEDQEHAETIHVAHWDLVDEGDKGLGEPLAPQTEEGGLAPVDDYPDAREIGEPGDDHAPDDGGVDLDISGVVWGEAVE
jgi:hypothetical protein